MRMTRFVCIVALLVYVVLYVLGVGAVHARWIAVDGGEFGAGSACPCRESLWFAYAWNLIPLGPLGAVVVTAGYADGFRYSCATAQKAPRWPS